MSASPYSPVRRVVTGHTPEGESSVLKDMQQPPRFWYPGATSPIYDLHWTSEAPARLDTELTSPNREWVDESLGHPEVVSLNGSVFRALDMAPGDSSPWHRTESCDYVIVMKGIITLELQHGEPTALKTGDVIVQRATMHRWVNKSAVEWATIYYVAVPAIPVEVGGKKLEAYFPPQ
uniref:Cupin type-2 domain-containing protein n=1 Tax=Mycena chlorophos TaxID=658473 RepID=A0ABQ0LVM8_MYCCL|nr:predicted protein [Mycena chlorophos]